MGNGSGDCGVWGVKSKVWGGKCEKFEAKV